MGNPAEETYCYPNKTNCRVHPTFVNPFVASREMESKMTGLSLPTRGPLHKFVCSEAGQRSGYHG